MTTITVNGKPHTVQASPDTPLLYVLRNEVQLNGPKYGCGLAQCGACMVLIDGQPMPSCVIPVSGVRGPVVTVEGLGTPDRPHPLQKAFIEEQAAQCGYCTSGMIISAAALLQGKKPVSDAEIRAGLERNLCRCGSHMRVIAAVKKAAGGLA